MKKISLLLLVLLVTSCQQFKIPKLRFEFEGSGSSCEEVNDDDYDSKYWF